MFIYISPIQSRYQKQLNIQTLGRMAWGKPQQFIIFHRFFLHIIFIHFMTPRMKNPLMKVLMKNWIYPKPNLCIMEIWNRNFGSSLSHYLGKDEINVFFSEVSLFWSPRVGNTVPGSHVFLKVNEYSLELERIVKCTTWIRRSNIKGWALSMK